MVYLCLILAALVAESKCQVLEMREDGLFESLNPGNIRLLQLNMTATVTATLNTCSSYTEMESGPGSLDLDGRRVLPSTTCSVGVGGCSQCSDTTPGRYCRSCASHYFYVEASCSCQECSALCLTCSSLTTCLTCAPNLFLNTQNACVAHQSPCAVGASEVGTQRCTSCPPGFVLVDHDCLPCDSNCKTCVSFSECSSCVVGQFLKPSKSCEQCPSVCSACTSFENCTQCVGKLFLIDGVCQPGKSDSCTGDRKLLIGKTCLTRDTPETSYKLDSKAISIVFQQSIKEFSGVLAMLEVKLFTSNGAPFQHFEAKSSSWKDSGKILEIQVEITKDIFEGYFEITQKDKAKVSFAGTSTFMHPEEKLKAHKVSEMKSVTFAGIAGSSQTISGVSGQGSSAIMATASPFMPGAGTMMIKIANFFEYLHYTEGKKVVLPNMVLNSAGMVLIPIPIDNYLEVDEAELDCRPPTNYEAKTVSCSFLNNYGMALLIMGIVLIISMSIFVVYKLVQKQNSKTFMSRCAEFVYSSFGPKYFLITFEAANTEMFGFIFLNIFRANLKPKMIYGTVLSLLVLTGLGVLSFFAWQMIKDYLKKRSSIEISAKEKEELDSSQADALKDPSAGSSAQTTKQQEQSRDTEQMCKALEEGRYVHLSFLIEEYSPNLPKWYYYTPLASILKNLLCQLVVVSLADCGLIQVYLLCLLQTAYTAFYLKVSPMKERLNNWVSNLTNVMFSGYLMILIACNYIDDEDFVQYKMGNAMAFILIGILIVNVLYVFYSFIKLLVLATVSIVARIKAMKLKSKESRPEKRGEDNSTPESDSESPELKHSTTGSLDGKSTTGTSLIDPIPILNSCGTLNKVFPSKPNRPLTKKVVDQVSSIPVRTQSPVKKFTKEETAEMIKKIEQIHGI
jgi:hypothetical protein